MKLSFLLFFLLFAPPVLAQAVANSANERPMYGSAEKTPAEKAADQQLIDGVRQRGISLSDASRAAAQTGFKALQQKDYSTAIKRFNQSWLLDQNNGDAYYGFAMITAYRDKNPVDADMFFNIALQKGNADNSLLISYAQFLFGQGKFAAGIPYLEQLLKAYPVSPGARPMLAFAYRNQGNIPKACEYAQATIQNNEKLAKGALDDYCTK